MNSLGNVGSVALMVCLTTASVPCPEELGVRLLGGPDQYSGLLEVCSQGQWGTVCGNGILDNKAAAVVCRELGHPVEGASVLYNSQFKEGDGPVLLSDIKCGGQETKLSSCGHSPVGQLSGSCDGHQDDISIRCIGECVRSNTVTTHELVNF